MKYIKLFESFNDIEFNIDIDDEYTEIIASVGGDEIGKLVLCELIDSYSYEFDDVFDEDTFYELFPNDLIIKVEHIEIGNEYKSSGYGRKIMLYGLEYMKNKGYTQFYLNASPMGFDGLRTDELVEFYESVGFKVILDQGHNKLMSLIVY